MPPLPTDVEAAAFSIKSCSAFRWERVVAVTVFTLNAPVQSVHGQFGALILSDLPAGIGGLLLVVEVA